MSEKISILMPIKNAGPYLADCLNSIINQTESNWELIAVNDLSTDSSLNILNEYANKEKRIKVFTNNGQGIIDALRLAYANSSGNLITRMDADDLMAADKLQLLKQKLIVLGQGYLATGLVKYFANAPLGDGYKKYEAWLNKLTKNHNNFSEIYKECVIPSPCWMVYKSDLEKCEAFKPNHYPEDYDLCFRFYKNKLKVVGVNKILHHWRDYPTRTSRTDEHYEDNRFLNIKLHYFLQLDYEENKTLALWGAGKKGKFIAKHLIKKNIKFMWLSNNSKKIGKQIYDVKVENCYYKISNQKQYIVAVAQAEAQLDITMNLNNENLQIGTNYFFFC